MHLNIVFDCNVITLYLVFPFSYASFIIIMFRCFRYGFISRVWFYISVECKFIIVDSGSCVLLTKYISVPIFSFWVVSMFVKNKCKYKCIFLDINSFFQLMVDHIKFFCIQYLVHIVSLNGSQKCLHSWGHFCVLIGWLCTYVG